MRGQATQVDGELELGVRNAAVDCSSVPSPPPCGRHLTLDWAGLGPGNG